MEENKTMATLQSAAPQAQTTTAKTNSLSIFSDAKSFEVAQRMANALASSTVIPKEYQKNIGNCLIAIEMAARINTSPMMVMQNLYIVNGRPSWSSQWIIAMINSSHRYKTELQFDFQYDAEGNVQSCQAWAEDYSGHKVKGPKISMQMAHDEGWLTKEFSKWRTMPEVMIQYRAASFFGRMNCPDMIMGIYSAEEVYDMGDTLAVDGTGLTVDEKTGEVIETPIEEDNPITQEQRQAMFALAKEHLGADANRKLKEIIRGFGYESTMNLPVSVYNKAVDSITHFAEERLSDTQGNLAQSGGEGSQGHGEPESQ